MGFLPADLLNSYFQSSYFIESCQNRLTAFRTNNFSFKSNVRETWRVILVSVS